MGDISEKKAPRLKFYLECRSASGRSIVPVGAQSLTIGRATDATISLREPKVSRRHAIITPLPGRLMLLDMGSSNGTLVNGVVLSQAWLRDGDVVSVGETDIVVRAKLSYPKTTRLANRPEFELESAFLPERRLELILDLSARLTCTDTGSGAAEVLLDIVMKLIPADRALVWLATGAGEARQGKVIATRSRESEATSEIKPQPDLIREVLETGKPVFRERPMVVSSTRPRYQVCAKLRLDGRRAGAIYLEGRAMPELVGSAQTLDLLSTLTNITAPALIKGILLDREVDGAGDVASSERPREEVESYPSNDRQPLVEPSISPPEQIERHRCELESCKEELESLKMNRISMARVLTQDLEKLVVSLEANFEAIEQRLIELGDEGALIEDAYACSLRITAMTAHILDVQRLQDGTYPLKMRQVDLAEVIARTSHRHAPRADKEGVYLDLAPIDEALCVKADRAVVSRVLDSLMDSAIGHAGPEGWVSLVGRQDLLSVEVVVDTKPGIVRERRESVSADLSSLDDSDEIHHDLGLYYCRLAMEAQGGDIRIERLAGEDRVIISLPRAVHPGDKDTVLFRG